MNMNDILMLEWINICETFLEDHPPQHDEYDDDEWDEGLRELWCGIVSTKYLNLILIEKCIEMLPKLSIGSKRKVCSAICGNVALTMDMLLAYPELEWKNVFYGGSHSMNIHDILNHPELKWKWNAISMNPSVTMEVVLSNIDKPWSWVYLSKHPNITMLDIESHMDLP